MGTPAPDAETFTAVMRDGVLMSIEDAAKWDEEHLDEIMTMGTGVSHRKSKDKE